MVLISCALWWELVDDRYIWSCTSVTTVVTGANHLIYLCGDYLRLIQPTYIMSSWLPRDGNWRKILSIRAICTVGFIMRRIHKYTYFICGRIQRGIWFEPLGSREGGPKKFKSSCELPHVLYWQQHRMVFLNGFVVNCIYGIHVVSENGSLFNCSTKKWVVIC